MTSSYTQNPTKKTHSISKEKLEKILEHNDRLKDQLSLLRIPVSEASLSLIEYCKSTQDPLLPSLKSTNKLDPFAQATRGNKSNGCCIIT
ncbi:unnamed protein product [Rhizopus stolonifer]